MPDVLGWRRKFGVLAPSTNTVVEPDFDDLRPAGVSNHLSRIFTPNVKGLSNETFRGGVATISSNVMDALKSVMTCARKGPTFVHSVPRNLPKARMSALIVISVSKERPSCGRSCRGWVTFMCANYF